MPKCSFCRMKSIEYSNLSKYNKGRLPINFSKEGGRVLKFSRLATLFAFILVLNTTFAGFALADDTENSPVPSPKVVALGDSITFGYPPPSTTAFPDFITGASEVTKFGGVGATSLELLNAIKSNPVEFALKVGEADVITINIGSNDFIEATNLSALFGALQPIVTNPEALQTALLNGDFDRILAENPLTPLTPAQGAQYSENLVTIIGMIASITDAPIILYNLYNPIVLNPALGEAFNAKLGLLHSFVELQLKGVNAAIGQIGSNPNIYVVDAYSTFQANSAAFIIPFDIHPTLAGHQALARLADSVINSLPPREDPVEEPPGENPPGENPGETPPVEEPPSENPPSEQPPGETPPSEEPGPQPPAEENPTPTPISKTNTKGVDRSGNVLPNTATPIYNYLVLGLGLVFIGMISLGLKQHHKRRN